MTEIVNADCIDFLRETDGYWQCVFADPPDNIGLDYDGVSDNLSQDSYWAFTSEWVEAALQKCDWLWISFNPRHVLTFSEVVSEHIEKIQFKPCVQTFTFGQYRSSDLANCHRMLWRLGRPGAKLYPEQILVPSWRSLNGDKRAAQVGRVPGDVFDFPRVTGNSKQRRQWHPTQLHEGLVERCIKLCTTKSDDVLDIFGGTGTTARVCQKIGRNCTIVEKSETYATKIREELA